MRSCASQVLLLLLVAMLAGCKSMTPGSMDRVQAHSDKPLAGNVYLLRGFIGIWSYGIDHLGAKIDAAGIRSSVYQESQWAELCEAIIRQYGNRPDPEPLVLIGHSYGADDAVRIARRLEEHNITVDLIVTLDPVTPPRVPANVRLCYNIYQSNVLDRLPFFRGVPLTPEREGQTNLVNLNIRTDRQDLLEPGTDHFNIEKNERVHAEVLRKLQEFCPPRDNWLAERGRIRYASPVGSPPASPEGIEPRPRIQPASGLDRVP